MRRKDTFPRSLHLHYVIRRLRSPLTTNKQIRQIHAHLLRRHSPLLISLSNYLIVAYAATAASTAFTFFAFHSPRRHLDELTFHSLLKSFANSNNSFLHINQLHSMSFKLGFSGYTLIQNGFIRNYIGSNRLVDARKLFDEMSHRDTASYNNMIHGYAESGDMDSASMLFSKVDSPNAITWTTMITGFANNGNISVAERLFDEMPRKDLVSWNAMITAYLRNHRPIDTLCFFRKMQVKNFKPNRVTVTSTLSACAALAALDLGMWVHVYVNKNKFPLDPFLGSGLIDMYTKCGNVKFALEIFESLKEKNTCTWNAMINGFAMNGRAKQALDLFNKMQLDNSARPDEVTFVGVLTACSHGGFLEEGRMHFFITLRKYRVRLILEHYACMVDLLGRCGLLSEAEEIVRSMPIRPDDVVWRALLGGCRIHKHIKLAERIVSEIKEHRSGDYVLLSNLYASVGRWSDLHRTRQLMKDKEIEKKPGCSCIEINNTIYEFISGESWQSANKEIRRNFV